MLSHAIHKIVTAGILLSIAASPSPAQDKAIGVSGQASSRPGRNWALVIGINGYANAPLKYCVQDATLLAETLKTACGYDPAHVFLMTDGLKDFKDIPTRNNVLETARQLADLPQKQDTLLVYFSGHGVSLDDKGYLVPIDARAMRADQLISIAELRKTLRASVAAQRVLILDACHSGGEKAGGSPAMTKTFEDSLKDDSEGLITLASCRASETSLEAPWHEQGLFTYWLSQGLGGLADRQEAGNRDGKVEITELYQFVFERVRTEAVKKRRHRQNPFLLASLSGKIELAKLTGKPIPAAPTPAPDPAAPPKDLALDLGGGVKLDLVLLPAGDFQMGSPKSEKGRGDYEDPVHRVRISKPFYMGKYEVTQSQWQAVMGRNPSGFKGTGDLPVESVSWDNCQEFCKKLSAKIGREIRLPSEAEWEYGCRAGSRTAYTFSDSADELDRYAWSNANSDDKTHSVGDKRANGWGLYDMHGNVWEWCEDVWHDDYSGAPTDGRSWLRGGDPDSHIIRGGSWVWGNRGGLRSAVRGGVSLRHRNFSGGFRIVASLPLGN